MGATSSRAERREKRRRRRRRGRVLIASMAIGAIGAFTVGAAVGADSDSPPPERSPASFLSVDQLAGQRVIGGFSGTSVPASLERGIAQGRLAGVILFADNFPSRSAGASVIRQLQRIKRPARLRAPLLVMIDQEGGLVKRVSGAPSVSAEAMGRRGPAFSRHQGKLTAGNLRSLGVNVDLAPVLDVGRPGGNIESTDRAFGTTARAVERTAIPFAQGLQTNGVAATAKHFPGLGSVALNTDDAVQRVNLSKAALRKVDEAPYERYAAIGGDLVMVGTAIYPDFGERPAAFNRSVVTGELRNRIGYEGVTITDALEATAARAFGGPAKTSVAAAKAGMDLMLFGDHREALRAQTALAKQIRARAIKRRDAVASADRVLGLRDRLRRTGPARP